MTYAQWILKLLWISDYCVPPTCPPPLLEGESLLQLFCLCFPIMLGDGREDTFLVFIHISLKLRCCTQITVFKETCSHLDPI